MKCYNCGYENNDNAKFCNECGISLNEDIEEIHNSEIIEKDNTSIIKNINDITQENECINEKKDKNKTFEISDKLMRYKSKGIKLSKKKKIIIGIALILVSFMCIPAIKFYKDYQYKTGYNLTYTKKVNNIENLVLEKKYLEAGELNRIYFKNDDYNQKSIEEKIYVCHYDDDILTFTQADEKLKKDKLDKQSKQISDKEYNEKFKEKYGFDPKLGKNYDVSIGMTKDEVLNSKWGRPQDVNKTTTKYGVHEQWVYRNKYLYFDDEILTSIQE